REGVIDAPMARYLRDHGYDANLVTKFQNQALTVQQQHEAQLKNLQEARTTLMFGPQFSEAQNKARAAELATAGQTNGCVKRVNDLAQWLARQGGTAKQYYAGLTGSGLPLEQITNTIQMGAVAPKPGETMPFPQPVQEQKVQQAAAQGLAAAQAGIAAQNIQNQALANAVKQDPTLFSRLSSADQNKLTPLLAQQSFTP